MDLSLMILIDSCIIIIIALLFLLFRILNLRGLCFRFAV